MKLLNAAAQTVAIPVSTRESIIQRIFGESESLPEQIKSAYVHVSRNRIVQFGEVVIDASGKQEILFPAEMYATVGSRAQSDKAGDVVMIRGISGKSMSVYAAPGTSVAWVAVGEVWGGNA